MMKSWKQRMKKWGIGLCALLVTLMVGCQAVGGFQPDEAILSMLEVSSQEQSGSMTLTIEWNEDAFEDIDPQYAQLMAMFGKIDFQIHHAQSDGVGRFRIVGSVGLQDREPIGFTMQMDEHMLRFDVDGAKVPFVLELDEDFNPMMPMMSMMDQAAYETVQQEARKLLRHVATYFVKHLPNPEKLSVSRVVSDVNGAAIPLTKLQMELDGEQLGQLLVTYVEALASDEEGFRQMLKGVVQWVTELSPELLQLFGDEEAPTFSAEELEAELEEGFQELFPLLQQLNAMLAEWQEEPEWAQVFTPDITLKSDIYVDDRLHVRKTDTDIRIAPAIFSEPDSPVRSISIRSHSEFWNVNGDIEIVAVEKPRNAATPEQLDELSPVQFVRLFADDSELYRILKNDLQIDDSSFVLDGWYDYPYAPFYVDQDTEETLYVSIRQVVAEGFEDRISYTPRTGEIRFYDPGTWQEFVLHVGSDKALVNGESVQLSGSVIWRDGYTFMPADDLLTLLKAEYEVETTTFEDEDIVIVVVTVTRDL